MSFNTSAGALRNISFYFALSAILCLLLADLEISTPEPWTELGRMLTGVLTPNLGLWKMLLEGTATTLAFALQGITAATIIGFILAINYHRVVVRIFCAFIRSIHELFWALLIMQVAGLSTTTGLLAIAIPYTGTLAKIYGELFEEHKPAFDNRDANPARLSLFFYTVLPVVWRPLQDYTRYRFECAIRSSVVLGFVGLPTLGFHLESALREGQYSDAAMLLYGLLLLVGTLRFWLKKRLLPIYILAALYYLPPTAVINWDFALRFFTEDIVPAPLRHQGLSGMGTWIRQLWQHQLWPGLIDTLILSQLALVVTAVLALALFPLNSPLFFQTRTRVLGDLGLIILRTLPEYLLAFIGLLLFGPSMLPAVFALSLHNAGIIAHLLGHYSVQIKLREDATQGLNRYAYEVLPRLYRQFLAFLFYRWEVILRETAIVGILGISTLGFYIDSAFEEFRFDRAIVLILASAFLNMGVDRYARYLRLRLHVKSTPETI